MNLRFIGTGTLASARIKNKLSKDYRRFSTLLIDEKILIDPSQDIFEFEESFMLSGLYNTVKSVLITHSHLDHFSISAIEELAAKRCITVYCDKAIAPLLSEVNGVSVVSISPFSLFKAEDYDILPLPSNHKTDIPSETAYNFLIRKDKTLFYGLDGAFINPEAWKILGELKPGAYVLECALADGGYSRASVFHNNFDMVLAIKAIIEEAGALNPNTKFIISHIPTSKKRSIHDELSALAADHGVKVAYDGYYLAI